MAARYKRNTHRTHAWYIYLHLPLNVGKYTIHSMHGSSCSLQGVTQDDFLVKLEAQHEFLCPKSCFDMGIDHEVSKTWHVWDVGAFVLSVVH